MKLYRNAEGTWVGTQAEAHNKDIIEVPVDKPGLLEWLNVNARNRTSLDTGDADRDDNDDLPIGTASPDDLMGKCPKCKLTAKGAEARAEAIKLDDIVDRIINATSYELVRLCEAVAERMVAFIKLMKS